MAEPMSTMFEPCPFCGTDEKDGELGFFSDRTRNGGKGMVSVFCGGCGANSPWFPFEAEARGAWNRRAADGGSPHGINADWALAFADVVGLNSGLSAPVTPAGLRACMERWLAQKLREFDQRTKSAPPACCTFHQVGGSIWAACNRGVVSQW